MNDFVDSLKSLGVDTVAGDICADFSMKDDDRLGEGWCWDDDNPVLSPLLVSRKDDFAESFKKKLDRAGIVVEGNIRAGRTPGSARKICTVERPIGDVMIRMMKRATIFIQSRCSIILRQRPAIIRLLRPSRAAR